MCAASGSRMGPLLELLKAIAGGIRLDLVVVEDARERAQVALDGGGRDAGSAPGVHNDRDQAFVDLVLELAAQERLKLLERDRIARDGQCANLVTDVSFGPSGKHILVPDPCLIGVKELGL